VSGPECTDAIECHLGRPAPEPLSQAALYTLAIIAYEQPVTCADIRAIRSVDSDAVVETLRARGLVAEDPRLWRPRPAWLSHHHAGVLAVLRLALAQQPATS
jgi:segregation and condensation protein B